MNFYRKDQFDKIVNSLLNLGIIWVFSAYTLLTVNKHFWQISIVLFYLPSLYVIVVNFSKLATNIYRSKIGLLFLILSLWALLSLYWSINHNPPLQEGKYVLMVFCGFWVLAYHFMHYSQLTDKLFLIISLIFTVSSCIVLFLFFNHANFSWQQWITHPGGFRLQGFSGMQQNAIAFAYPAGAAATLLGALFFQSKHKCLIVLCGAILALSVFLSQSRAAILALFASLCFMGFCYTGKKGKWISAICLILCFIGVLVFKQVFESRGISYRDALFFQSIAMIKSYWLTGIGIDSSYRLVTAGILQFHSHNVFLIMGIQLGVFGLCVWLAIWFLSLGFGWKLRKNNLGKMCCALWVYGTIAGLFDGANLWNKPDNFWILQLLPIILGCSCELWFLRQRQDRLSAQSS